MRLAQQDYLLLYKNIFRQECIAFIKSREYRKRYLDLPAIDRKKIEENLEDISYFAAQYLIDTFGTNLNNDDSRKAAIVESLSEALRQFL
jgi:hypothetical protein